MTTGPRGLWGSVGVVTPQVTDRSLARPVQLNGPEKPLPSLLANLVGTATVLWTSFMTYALLSRLSHLMALEHNNTYVSDNLKINTLAFGVHYRILSPFGQVSICFCTSVSPASRFDYNDLCVYWLMFIIILVLKTIHHGGNTKENLF